MRLPVTRLDMTQRLACNRRCCAVLGINACARAVRYGCAGGRVRIDNKPTGLVCLDAWASCDHVGCQTAILPPGNLKDLQETRRARLAPNSAHGVGQPVTGWHRKDVGYLATNGLDIISVSTSRGVAHQRGRILEEESGFGAKEDPATRHCSV